MNEFLKQMVHTLVVFKRLLPEKLLKTVTQTLSTYIAKRFELFLDVFYTAFTVVNVASRFNQSEMVLWLCTGHVTWRLDCH